MGQVVRRGLFQSFNSSAYTASVLLLEATSFYLQNVPVATHIDGTSAQAGAYCAVLFFDEQNYADAVVIAIYPNGSQGIPLPAPGRVVLVTPFQQLNAVTINAGTTNTYTLTGGGTGIPAGAHAVLARAFYGSATVGAYVQFAPHSGSIDQYWVLGNTSVASQNVGGNAILPVDANGQVDVKANTGNCTVTMYTYGYVF